MENNNSIRLNRTLCKGCTNCIKRCPTRAIRVRNGKAMIINEKCIDCGECVRVCPYHAKGSVTDKLDIINGYKHKVALVSPAFYAQFTKTDDINAVASALIKIGFDDVYDQARGSEAVVQKTRELISEGKLKTPVISSSCPAVMRLIATRFPNLIENILPLKSSMEVAARAAKIEAKTKTGLCDEEIGVFYISPCAAQMTAMKSPMTTSKTYVDGVISISDVYMKIAHTTRKIDEITVKSKAGRFGMLCAVSGGEIYALGEKNSISVDGVENVIRVFEDIEDGKMHDIVYVEAASCTCGCVGGTLTSENAFAARARLERLTENMERHGEKINAEDIFADKKIEYNGAMQLSRDMSKAIKMAERINEIYKGLPKLDCGSCGCPSCHTFAEDIVLGRASEYDCIFKLRRKLRELEGDDKK